MTERIEPSATPVVAVVGSAGGIRAMQVVLGALPPDLDACVLVVIHLDGAAGAAAVKQAGGRVLAQNEATSQYFGMPGAAILAGGVDEVLPLDEIAPAVVRTAPLP
jgi:chemotaxis response regulator CheB